MKKLTSIISMLLIAIVVTLASCSAVTIVNMIHDINDQCPIDLGDGIVLKSAVLNDKGDAVFTYDAKQISSDAITDEMVENFKNSLASDAEMVKLMKDSNTKLIFRYNCSDDTVDVTYEATDL